MPSSRADVLKTLHAASSEIQAAESVTEACEQTVAAAEEILEFEMCSVLIHDDGYLDPIATSAGAPLDGARRMPDDHGLAGKTYQTGESYVVDEIGPDDETDPAKDFYRSGISVPVDTVGVFQAVSREPAAFDDSDLEFTELLVSHTARAIDQIQYEQQLEEKQAQLQRQNERLENFVSVVSHDLRHPLSTAAGHLELAREAVDNQHLDQVAQAHERMEALIDDLLALAREGAPVTNTESVALEDLATQCRGIVETTGGTLSVETSLVVRANRQRLRQLLENLLRNAVEHGGEDVTVTVGDLDDASGFYVADDGPGIPAEGREQVFEKGYSTDDSGTGFGLAIVSEIAQAHGWTVRVTDSDSGGARFEITDIESSAEQTGSPE